MLRRILTILVAGAALGIAAVAVGIWIVPDHDEITNNDFATANAVETLTSFAPISAIWTQTTPAEPGGYVQGKLAVTNDGADPAIVELTSITNTNATLAAGLRIIVSRNAADGGLLPNPCSNATASMMDAEGANGAFRVGESFLNNPSVGDLTTYTFNDTVAPIPVGGTTEYCIEVKLPSTAPITLQNLTNDSTFIFDNHN